MNPPDHLFTKAMSRRCLFTIFGMGIAAVVLDACGSRISYYGVSITEAGTFDPSPLTIARGARVVWINKNAQPYTITCDPSQVSDKAHVSLPDNALAWASPILYTGQTWAYVFNTSGSYLYSSRISNSEESIGQITVTS